MAQGDLALRTHMPPCHFWERWVSVLLNNKENTNHILEHGIGLALSWIINVGIVKEALNTKQHLGWAINEQHNEQLIQIHHHLPV